MGPRRKKDQLRAKQGRVKSSIQPSPGLVTAGAGGGKQQHWTVKLAEKLLKQIPGKGEEEEEEETDEEEEEEEEVEEKKEKKEEEEDYVFVSTVKS